MNKTVDDAFNVINKLRIEFLLTLLDPEYGNVDLKKIPDMEFTSNDLRILKKCKSFEEFYKNINNK